MYQHRWRRVVAHPTVWFIFWSGRLLQWVFSSWTIGYVAPKNIDFHSLKNTFWIKVSNKHFNVMNRSILYRSKYPTNILSTKRQHWTAGGRRSQTKLSRTHPRCVRLILNLFEPDHWEISPKYFIFPSSKHMITGSKYPMKALTLFWIKMHRSVGCRTGMTSVFCFSRNIGQVTPK